MGAQGVSGVWQLGFGPSNNESFKVLTLSVITAPPCYVDALCISEWLYKNPACMRPLKLPTCKTVLLSASVERFGVSRMQDFFMCISYGRKIKNPPKKDIYYSGTYNNTRNVINGFRFTFSESMILYL